ncbi:MAG: oxygenase MpaB family protein [Anaerolineales bacterium]
MPSTKWTNEFLDEMRFVADPLADEVVLSIIQSGGLDEFNKLIRHLVNNRDSLPDTMPKIVRDYFEQTEILPEWVDMEKVVRGERVFDAYGPEMITMLFFVSLPYAYATKKGSHVLSITAELTRHVHRRIFRTAQFIMDVMQSGGLGASGRGVRSAQKIRLLHASIRYYISHKDQWREEWDSSWGLPINQEDMAGTLMDFSVGVMRGLKRSKIFLSPEEEEAYLHCWKVVGHIIGVRTDLIPESVEDAFDLAQTIIERQVGPSTSGKALSSDLIQFIQGFLPRLFFGFPAVAIRYLSGNQIANVIESGPYNWTLGFLYFQIVLFGFIEKLKRIFPFALRYVRYLTWWLIDKMVLFEEGGQTYFDIPDDLRRRWRLSSR